MRRLSFLPLLLLATPAAALDPTDATCSAVRVALPTSLVGWNDRTDVVAGVSPGQGGTVIVGKGANVSLHPARHLSLAPAPAKAAAADSSGGTLAFMVTDAATYRVALGAAAWIDVVQGGKALASAAHAHGPKCTGIAKVVDFKLTPGTYAIQLSGSATPTIPLMVAKLG